jgi:hypothetical protein
MALTAFFFIVGAALALCFRVLILIPATIFAAIVVGWIEMTRGQDVWFSALMTVVAVIAIQIGYLAASYYVAATPQKPLGRPRLGFHEWFSRTRVAGPSTPDDMC